jgi:hypothetical protein
MRRIVIALLPLAVALQTGQKPPEPTGFAPIAFFNKKCVYCHAKDGEAYSPAALRGYSEAALAARLLEMTEERAKAPLTDKEREVLASWFRSLGKEQPYVAWVSWKDGEARFEASKGARVTTNKGTVRAVEGVWVITGVAKPTELVVTAAVGSKKTVLKLADSAVSHPRPKSTP